LGDSAVCCAADTGRDRSRPPGRRWKDEPGDRERTRAYYDLASHLRLAMEHAAPVSEPRRQLRPQLRRRHLRSLLSDVRVRQLLLQPVALITLRSP